MGHPGPKATKDVGGRPKATFGGGDPRYKPSGGELQCYNSGQMCHYAKECQAPKAQLQAAHTAAARSNIESNVSEETDELIKDEEGPSDVEEQSLDNINRIKIDGD
ncbi:hypothetical protein C0993_002609, partial [Termitomyces sp. T159_Od127]